MTAEPFSHDDTQFVVDTINRDTIEQAHAILTGLIERGWTPPPATGNCTCDRINASRPGRPPEYIRGRRDPNCTVHTEETP